jgi:hypothetical protein
MYVRMKTIGQELWKLSTAMQSLKQRDEEEIVMMYGAAMALANRAEVPSEKMWAEKLVDDIKMEMERRHLDFFMLYVRMDLQGNFLRGREELKRFFLSMDFFEMDKIIGRILQNCISNEQYNALIELEREVLMETSGGAVAN